jgi:nucleoside-diphosphate-sugar epimerase
LRVLITGADGFVGKAVCRRLLDAGLTPRAGLWNASLWPVLQTAVPGLDEFAAIGDLGATPELSSALRDVSAVVHLAARVHIMKDKASIRSANSGASTLEGPRPWLALLRLKACGGSSLSVQ